jgi:hypothetical protein
MTVSDFGSRINTGESISRDYEALVFYYPPLILWGKGIQ